MAELDKAIDEFQQAYAGKKQSPQPGDNPGKEGPGKQ
jgi:hypothetical protein